MSLAETKEVIKILATATASLTVIFFIVLYAIAKITYKKAHKAKKVHKAQRNMNVMFNIDSKNKTLQEIQLEKAQMIKILGGI